MEALSWTERIERIERTLRSVQGEEDGEDVVTELLREVSFNDLLEAFRELWIHPHPSARALPAAAVSSAVLKALYELDGGGAGPDVMENVDAMMARYPELADDLCRSLSDPSPLVRRRAVRALSVCVREGAEDPWLATKLGRLSQLPVSSWSAAVDDEDGGVRAQVWRSPAAATLPQATLLTALDDAEVRVRAAALPSVQASADAPLRARVVDLAHGEGLDADAALEQLAGWRTAQGTDALEARLRRRPDRLALTCAARGAWSSVPPALLLHALSADPSTDDARLAARALTRWCDPSCGPALVEALQAPDGVAMQAAIALCRGAPAGCEPTLEALLASPEANNDHLRQMLRNAAVRALGSIGTRAAYDALTRCDVRPFRGKAPAPDAVFVCGALGMLERPEAVPRIRALSADNVYSKRVWSVALGQCGGPGVEDELRSLVTTKDAHLPALAALGLQLLRPERDDLVPLLRRHGPCLAASFEPLALAVLGGLRSLGRREGLHRKARAACLEWAEAMGPALDEMVACYRGHGRMSGYSMSYVWWFRDLHRLALTGLRAR